jgi:hypothetical protein
MDDLSCTPLPFSMVQGNRQSPVDLDPGRLLFDPQLEPVRVTPNSVRKTSRARIFNLLRSSRIDSKETLRQAV